MFNPRVPSPIDISPPPSYSSLSPVMSSPTLTRYPAPRGDVSDEPHESQRLLGIVLDRAKYEETSPSPPLSCPIWEGGADVFSFPGFTRSISLLLDRSSPSSYTDPDGLSSGAHTLVSSFHASSPCKPKQNLSGSRLAILVPSPTLSQSISSSRALLFDSDDSAISSSPLNSSSPNTISSFATVYIPFPESLPIISDPSHPNMLLHAPMPTRHIPRGVSRLSPLERGAREMLGESAPETRMPTPQKHFSSLYERTGSTLISPLSPPQSRFSARLRKLAPPALQLAPTSVEFCSPGSSASISGLRILQASSAQQGTTAIGLGINVPRIVQPEILVQQTPSPVHSPQVTRTPAVPEPEEAQDPQVPQFGCLGSADSPALEYMDIGSPRTPPNLPRPTLLSLPTVTPAVSQGVHYGFTSPFETVRGQQRDLVEDVPMLPAYVEVAEADRYPRHLGAHILDQSIVDTSRLPALDLLFVARSDTGDLLDRVARCVDVIHPIGLVSRL